MTFNSFSVVTRAIQILEQSTEGMPIWTRGELKNEKTDKPDISFNSLQLLGERF